jgi:hypothetical protein
MRVVRRAWWCGAYACGQASTVVRYVRVWSGERGGVVCTVCTYVVYADTVCTCVVGRAW